MFRFQQTCLAACAAALLLAAAPAAAASDCVPFSNLKHCPLGGASLAVSNEALQVSGIGSEGKDGVAVVLPDARTWAAGVQLANGDTEPRIVLGAAAGGEEISSAEIVTKNGRAFFSASFTGSDGPGTYSILVYSKGTLVGSQGGVSSDRWWGDPGLEWVYWYFFFEFMNRMSDGACVWTFSFPQPLHLVLPDGTKVDGDEVHLVEEVDRAGHYPYVAFDGITLRSSRDLQILSEEAQ